MSGALKRKNFWRSDLLKVYTESQCRQKLYGDAETVIEEKFTVINTLCGNALGFIYIINTRVRAQETLK